PVIEGKTSGGGAAMRAPRLPSLGAPAVPLSAPAIPLGAPQLGDIFAGGVPKLKHVNRSGSSNAAPPTPPLIQPPSLSGPKLPSGRPGHAPLMPSMAPPLPSAAPPLPSGGAPSIPSSRPAQLLAPPPVPAAAPPLPSGAPPLPTAPPPVPSGAPP